MVRKEVNKPEPLLQLTCLVLTQLQSSKVATSERETCVKKITRVNFSESWLVQGACVWCCCCCCLNPKS